MDPSLRTWATAHARTVGARGPRPSAPPSLPEPPPLRPSSGPVQITARKIRELSVAHGLSSAAWTVLPDGRPLLATADGAPHRGTVRIWDGVTGACLHTLTGHAGYASSVAWAPLPDGRLLLASGGGGGDGTARIWDGRTGALLRTINVDSIVVYSLAWTVLPDGRPLLATGSLSREAARIWDGETGVCLHTLTGHTSLVETVAWAQPAGRPPLLATGSQDRTARIWDGETGTCLQTLTGHNGTIRAVAWTVLPDGRPLLATGGYDSATRVWDGDTGECLYTLPSSTVYSLAWTVLPGGQPLLAVSDGGETSIWDVDRQTCVTRYSGGSVAAWARPPDGRLLLVTGGVDVFHIWEVAAETPASSRSRAGRSGSSAGSPAQSAGDTGPSKTVIKGIKEITPGPLAQDASTVVSADAAVTPDGRLLIATADSRGTAHVSDGSTGMVLQTLPGFRDRVAWAASGEGLRLVTGDPRGTVDLWDCYTPAHIRTWSPWASTHRRDRTAQSVACAVLPDGQLRLAHADGDGVLLWNEGHGAWPLRCGVCAAPAGQGDLICVNCGANLARNEATTKPHYCQVCAAPVRRADLICPNCGANLRPQRSYPHARQPGPDSRALSFLDGAACVAWAVLADSGLRLAVGYRDGFVRIWDGNTGALLHPLYPRDGAVHSVAWARLPDGRLRLAAGGENGTATIWDGNSGAPLHTVRHREGTVLSVAWAALPDGRLLLATAGSANTVHIWDGHTGEPVSAPLNHGGWVGSANWALMPDGRLLLITGGLRSGPRIKDGNVHSALRIRQVQLDPPVDHIFGTRVAAGPVPAAVSVLLACGSTGLWPPLGLLEDLVALTGRGGRAVALHDERLRALTDHPGIQRLRELDWPARARLAFAVLLVSRLSADAAYCPPAAAGEPLREALSAALAELRSPAVPSGVRLDELRAAADAVADRSIALLTIIGPGAASADPLLPLRLSHYVPRLPALGERQLRLLGAARSPRTDRRPGGGTEQHAPGTAGVSRHGTLTQLLPTQLALPRDLLTVRQLGDQLLYRRHLGQVPPTPRPVTLILDTTPPTHGPAEQVLRLAAHLITTTLWEYGEHPMLISLTRPQTALPLTEPAHLLHLWSTRTLDPPGPALATAFETAHGGSRPTVLLTHHHTAERSLPPGPGRYLVTTHHPPEPTPTAPGHPCHHHLPPDPTQTQLAETVRAILVPGPGDPPAMNVTDQAGSVISAAPE